MRLHLLYCLSIFLFDAFDWIFSSDTLFSLRSIACQVVKLAGCIAAFFFERQTLDSLKMSVANCLRVSHHSFGQHDPLRSNQYETVGEFP